MIHETTYNELLLKPEWKNKRKEILSRDGYCCRNCGRTDSLQIHHRQYHYDKKTGLKLVPWDYADKYLLTLCETCHSIGHQLYSIPSFKN